MNVVWVLVCDAARARLFEVKERDNKWHLTLSLTHEESRKKATELVSDHAGRSSPPGGSVHHNALAPASTPKEVEQGHFVHSLIGVMDQAMRSNRFSRWVLVAPPHFLGMLKQSLTPELTKHLMATVDKDLSHVESHELADTLRAVVHIPADQRDVVRQQSKHVH